MQRTKIRSALLASVGYDPATKVLEVEFLKQQNDRTRRIYQYLDVPPEKYKEMIGHDADPNQHSVGAYFLVNIRSNFECKRVEEPVENEKENSATA